MKGLRPFCFYHLQMPRIGDEIVLPPLQADACGHVRFAAQCKNAAHWLPQWIGRAATLQGSDSRVFAVIGHADYLQMQQLLRRRRIL